MNCDGESPNCSDALAIVSGSGLRLERIFDRIERVEPFTTFDGMTSGELVGHPRTFTFGSVGSQALVLQSGRYHFYEGLGFRAITRPVDLLYEWGIRTVVFTNVSGGLRPTLEPGHIVAVDRLLTWPYSGWTERPDSIAPDFAPNGADSVGTYIWVHGPTYETPAEIRLLQRWGGDVVGMSTAPEVQRCRQLGIRTTVLSCVTNTCGAKKTLTHEDVVTEAGAVSEKLAMLLREVVQREGCH